MQSHAVLLIALALPAGAIAQSSCPVRLQNLAPKMIQRSLHTPHAAKNEAHSPLRDLQLSVSVHNVAGKPVRGVKIQTAFLDAAGEWHIEGSALNAFRDFPENEAPSLNWNLLSYSGEDKAIGWIAVIRRVLFVDGTSWEFTASQPGCFGQWWADPNHPLLTALPLAEKFQTDPANIPSSDQ